MAAHRGGTESSALLGDTLPKGTPIDLSIQAGDRTTEDENQHEREVTRLEMWIDALASIVATLTILPLMEILNESKEERVLGIPYMIFSVTIGFVFISLILLDTYLVFNWFKNHHASDPILHGLGILFLACLSLFAFAIQSLLESYLDNSAVYVFGGTFVGINLSAFFIFIYCLYVTDIYQRVSRQSAIRSEILFFVATIATFVVMMVVSSFVSTGYQSYVMYGVIVAMISIHSGTRTQAHLSALLPNGFPKERIDVFTDGVYAVAATLFLIEIRYPGVIGHASHESIVIAFLKDEWRAVTGHFTSFVVLGFHWCLQNFISAMTQAPTRSMYAISMVHCMAAALFPFTIKLALLGEYSGWEIVAPLLCYFNIVLTQVLLWLRARGTVTERGAGWLLACVAGLTAIAYLGYEIFLAL